MGIVSNFSIRFEKMWIKIENLICNKISNLYSIRCYKIKDVIKFFPKTGRYSSIPFN